MAPSEHGTTQLNRRGFFLGAGAAAVSGVAGLALARPALAAADEGPSVAAAGGTFDLSVPAERRIREAALHHVTVMQSFAFDDVNHHLYAIQVMQGGLRLTGEPAAVSGADRAARGDMCITKLTAAGAELGHMYVRGFGHGVAIGVEHAGATPWLWTESDANPSSGYGRALSRYRFTNGAVLDSGSASLAKIRPVPGSTSNQVSIDNLNQLLLLRYRLGGIARYRLMRLADVKAGRFTALYDVPQAGVSASEVFQGFAVLGDHAYQMTGTAYTSESGSNPPSGRGNTYLTRLDLRTGTVTQRSRTEAAYSLGFREPEGVAVRLSSPRRLCLRLRQLRSPEVQRLRQAAVTRAADRFSAKPSP
ncbi:teichoic acid biosynthesis protein C [Streptomyces sp. NPDC059853]|uniref:phage baseplate protein n=1 Tax=Streptomyces sp. NPDC059853 TaxID=3346973 RepID=UPI0036614ADF